MKRTLKIITLLIVAFPVRFIIQGKIEIALLKHRLSKADHVHILVACREVIKNRSSYRNDGEEIGGMLPGHIYIKQPFPSEVPSIFLEIKAHSLMINDGMVRVHMGIPFSRSSILGFSENHYDYGTVKYIDGLWFSNGNFESEEMKSRVYGK